MGVLALLATSCEKKTNALATLTSTSEQMEVVAGEWDEGEKVQLSLDNNKLYFEEGDILTLFRINSDPLLSASADYTPSVTQVDQATWTPIGGAQLPQAGDLYAFCPGGDNYVVPDLANENRATFKVPSTQNYRANTCSPEGFFMAAKLEDGQEHFYFRNICGILQLKIYSPNNRKVTSIEVIDKGGLNLAGDVNMKIDKVDPDILTSLYRNYDPSNSSYMATLNNYIAESGYNVINQGSKMTLNCGNGVTVGKTAAKATNFFITLRPLALREGFTIKIYCEGGYVFTKSTTKNNIIGPNVLKTMPAFSI